MSNETVMEIPTCRGQRVKVVLFEDAMPEEERPTFFELIDKVLPVNKEDN